MRRMRHMARRSDGFTVVELVTAAVVLGVVLGALVTLFVEGSNSQIDANRRFQAQLNARQALERMRREVHCASDLAEDSGRRVVLTLPAACPGTGGVPAFVTWCTRSLGTDRNGVFRIAGSAASCTGGAQYADFVTTRNVFDFDSGSSGELGRLEVDLPVDLTPADTVGRWRLTDNLVLRNDTR
jgi:type II secretory pathway pseudopilin PulG